MPYNTDYQNTTFSAKGVLIISTLIIAALACQLTIDEENGGSQGTSLPIDQTPTTPADWYTLLFTDPENPQSDRLRGGPDKALADAIRSSRASVDIAALQINLWSIRDAAISAHRRGVTVRVVTESDYLNEDEVQELIDAGIQVLGDRREGLMHNKFVIIDRQEVWTGSMNLTINGAYRNDNNLIRIRSSQLAKNYTTEFEEMYVDDQFGPGSPANTPHPTFSINDSQLEVYFSPDDGTSSHIVTLIQSARESIHFLAFSFTSDELADAMIQQARAGVNVSGVFEESQYASNVGTEYDRLLSAGLDVHLDGNPRNMHHKVILIDKKIVITGSYNFSRSAETKNDENTLVIYDAEIALQFLNEFERIYNQAK
jgi:phosphatidylserine/phosphatidylglycerophosphate/cardiolipin synthase-like enzyme